MTWAEFTKSFWDRVLIKGPNECWVWTKGTNKGYGRLSVPSNLKWRKNDPAVVYASYVAYVITYGPFNRKKYDVLHTCDNPPCVNPNHLWLGTNLDNVRDMFEKGRAGVGKLGERNSNACMSQKIASQIRRDRRKGKTYKDLMKLYQCSRSTVYRVVMGLRYTE